MKVELPALDYREYQKPLIRYMRGGGRRAVWVAHRRSGKDVTCWQFEVEAAIQEVGTYYYCLPEFAHARRVIWEGMLNEGQRFISLIPRQLVSDTNESQMKTELINGSIIQLVGSDQYDRLVGTNPKGIVFSEYSITHPMAWQILRPILAANGGWAIFNGTPRGKNHFHDILQQAKADSSWFWSIDTASTTGVLSPEVLAKEKSEMDPDVYLQEYFCSFDAATKGAYYSEQLKTLREQQRLCKVPYEPALPVYTASDPGDVVYAIVYFQVHGKEVRVIDAEEFYSPSPATIFASITSKPFKRYGRHFFPSDATVKKMAAGQKSLMDQLREIGLTDMKDLPPQDSKMEGIKLVQSHFPSFWVDDRLEKSVIEPLANYAPKFYETRSTYSPEPEHNWASHMCMVAGTMIEMGDGTVKAIEAIRDGEYVKTPLGSFKVLHSGETGNARTTLRLTFANGAVVECTPEHKFFTDRGLVRSNELRYDDNVWTKDSIPRRSPLAESFTNYRDDIMSFLQVDEKSTAICTGRFGLSIMGLFRRATTSITRTMIRLTTTLGILSACPKNSITRITQKTASGLPADEQNRFFFNKPSPPPDTGMRPHRAEVGIRNTPGSRSRSASGRPETATSAAGNTTLHTLRDQSFVTSIVKCERLTKEGEGTPVYDLTVDSHHCYLANGILVSNSDAVRYMVSSLSLISSQIASRPQHRPVMDMAGMGRW